jgi:protein SCO1/2
VIVLTPDGQISRYIYGIDFDATDLEQSVRAATTRHVQDVVAGALVVCYQFDPLTSRYAPLVLNLVRIGGGLGFAVLLVWIARLWRADLRGTKA